MTVAGSSQQPGPGLVATSIKIPPAASYRQILSTFFFFSSPDVACLQPLHFPSLLSREAIR
jgi:hypothetical protein